MARRREPSPRPEKLGVPAAPVTRSPSKPKSSAGSTLGAENASLVPSTQDPTAPLGGGLETPPAAPPEAEIGVTGLRIFSGYLDEEFLPDLRGERGRKKFREMADNDSTCSAILAALSLTLRGVKWSAQPAGEEETDKGVSSQAQEAADFAESLFADMSHSFEDFISEVLTMLTFGWSYFEIVLKRRVGPQEEDAENRSQFDDGKIGIRKLAPRAQESLLRWEAQQDGGISGMWQISPSTGQVLYIPIERSLLFRTVSRKNSPEGVSILRSAYKSYFFLNKIQDIEAIGIERELAGLPVIYVPSQILTSTAAGDVESLNNYKKTVRDLRFNSQGGAVFTSEPYRDIDGNPTQIPQVRLELLKTGGTRALDTHTIKTGYQHDIANSALAAFILLGGADSRGSFALSKDKTAFFLRSCEAYLNQIAAVLNRFLLPRLWDYNGMDRALMPMMVPGNITSADLGVLGTYIQQLAGAGAPLFPDEELEAALREAAELPRKSAAALQAQQDQADQEAAAAAANVQATQAQADATAAQAAAAGKPKPPAGKPPTDKKPPPKEAA